MKPSFFTNHELVNTSETGTINTTIDAVIDDSYPYDLVDDGSSYSIAVERMEISPQAIRFLEDQTLCMWRVPYNVITPIAGSYISITNCFSLVDLLDQINNANKNIQVNLAADGRLRIRTIGGTTANQHDRVGMSEKMTRLFNMPSQHTADLNGGWNYSNSPITDIDQVIGYRVTTDLGIEGEQFNEGVTANVILDVSNPGSQMVFSNTITDGSNVKTQPASQSWTETPRQKIVYNASNDRRQSVILSSAAVNHIRMTGYYLKSESGSGLLEARVVPLPFMGVFRIKLGWYKIQPSGSSF